jgi:ribosomal protein S18 acetylase RimI-like enzyme
MIKVRLTRINEAEMLPDIERSAGRAFLQIPELSWIADDDVQDPESHRRAIAQGESWVSVEHDDTPLGFLSAEVMGDELHIWIIAVRYENQGRGHGKALLAKAMAAARERGLAAITLTTFRKVIWNEPFYQRLGFQTLGRNQLSARLEKIIRAECNHGLPEEKRCAMCYMII